MTTFVSRRAMKAENGLLGLDGAWKNAILEAHQQIVNALTNQKRWGLRRISLQSIQHWHVGPLRCGISTEEKLLVIKSTFGAMKAENGLLGLDGARKKCYFGSTSTNRKCFDKPEEMGIEEDIITKHTTLACRAPEKTMRKQKDNLLDLDRLDSARKRLQENY